MYPREVGNLPNHNDFLIAKKKKKIIKLRSTKCTTNLGPRGKGKDGDKHAFND